jgi:hypothetical protein
MTVSFTFPDAGSTPVTCGEFCATASDENKTTPASKIHFVERNFPRVIFPLLAVRLTGTMPNTGLTAEKVAITHLAQGCSI